MSTPISQHFSLGEFASHDHVAYPVNQKDDEDPQGRTWFETRLAPLVGILEIVREACGSHPMTVISGYRSPAHNASVGGAKASQHMAGRAVDVSVKGVSPADVHAKVLALYKSGAIKIGGLGVYPGWVHIDVRPQNPIGHLAQWDGNKVGDEVA